MKKTLLASTALATAGLLIGTASGANASERIKLGLSGYFQQFGVAVDQNIKARGVNPVTGQNNKVKTTVVDQKHNSEICFVGETTLDNGLTFGVNVQLVANTSADQIDESFLFIQSDTYGQVILGDIDNAGYLLHVTAPDGGISIDEGDMTTDSFWANTMGVTYDTTPISTTNLLLGDDDSGKFNYFTPRFAGIQLGASFIPQFEPGGDDNSSVYRNTSLVAPDVGKNTPQNGFAFGLNFSEDFNGFGVEASAGVLHANMRPNDVFGYNVGAQFSFAGFSFGGAWLNAQGTQTATTANVETSQVDGDSWTVGAAYETGPYKIGIGYFEGRNKQRPGAGTAAVGSTKDARLKMGNISGTYVLGPGVRIVGGVFAFDGDAAQPWKNRPAAANVNATGFNNNGIGGVIGVKLGL